MFVIPILPLLEFFDAHLQIDWHASLLVDENESTAGIVALER